MILLLLFDVKDEGKPCLLPHSFEGVRHETD